MATAWAPSYDCECCGLAVLLPPFLAGISVSGRLLCKPCFAWCRAALAKPARRGTR